MTLIIAGFPATKVLLYRTNSAILMSGTAVFDPNHALSGIGMVVFGSEGLITGILTRLKITMKSKIPMTEIPTSTEYANLCFFRNPPSVIPPFNFF